MRPATDATRMRPVPDRDEQRAAKRQPAAQTARRPSNPSANCAPMPSSSSSPAGIEVPAPRAGGEVERQHVGDVVPAGRPVDVFVPGLAPAAEIDEPRDECDHEHGADRNPRFLRHPRQPLACRIEKRRDHGDEQGEGDQAVGRWCRVTRTSPAPAAPGRPSWRADTRDEPGVRRGPNQTRMGAPANRIAEQFRRGRCARCARPARPRCTRDGVSRAVVSL